MNNIPKILFLLAAPLVAIPSISSAANVTVPTSGTSNWEQDWNGATVLEDGTWLVPAASAGDNAIINQGKTVQVDTTISVVAGTVNIGNTNSGQPLTTLEINSGGSLTTGQINVSGNADAGLLKVQGGTLTTTAKIVVTDNGTFTVSSGTVNANLLEIDAANPAQANTAGVMNVNGGLVQTTSTATSNHLTLNGDLNISGGTVRFVDPTTGGSNFTPIAAGSTGAVNLTGGTLEIVGQTGATDTIALNGEYNISGGTFSAVNGQTFTNTGTVFNINGDDATIIIDRFNNSTASRAGTINFNFDETGVSVIEESDSSYAQLSNLTLNIDGSLYTGEAGTFDLFDYNNIASSAGTVNITGFYGVEGVDYYYEDDTTGNYSRLVIVNVPETSSYTLIAGCLGLSAVMMRRRRS